MTYGIASTDTINIISASGLDLAYLEPTEFEPSLDIDVIFDGALDESFAVMAGLATTIAEVMFEAIVAEFPDKQIEVSVWERIHDVSEEVMTLSHDGTEGECGW